jgi:hypothetical protein
MQDFHERLDQLLVTSKVTGKDLYFYTSKSPSTISHYRNGKSFPDKPFFQALYKLIPNANGDWLLFGRGEMFINENLVVPSEIKANNNVKNEDDQLFLNSELADVEQKNGHTSTKSGQQFAVKAGNNVVSQKELKALKKALEGLHKRLEVVEKPYPNSYRRVC